MQNSWFRFKIWLGLYINSLIKVEIVHKTLRKGISSIYIQHENTGHTLSAENFCCDVLSGDLIIQLSLRPSQYIEYSLSHPIIYIEIDDLYILERLRNYLKLNGKSILTWIVEMKNTNKTVKLIVDPKKSGNESILLYVSN
jgi:hypothetical protein